MAFIKCSGGGKLKQTRLWINPIGINQPFATQDIDLDDSWRNYNYLQIIVRRSKSISDYPAESVISKDEFEVCSNVTERSYRWSVGSYVYSGLNGSSKDTWTRHITWNSSTNLHIQKAYQCGGSSNSNNNIIPDVLYGLKY